MDIAMELLEVCENISKKTLYNTRSVLLNQAKAFLQRMHDDSLQALQNALDSESWEETLIPKKYQKLIDKGFVPLLFGSSSNSSDPVTANSDDSHSSSNASVIKSSTVSSELSALEKLNALRSVRWDSTDFDHSVKSISGNSEEKTIEGTTYIIVDDEKFKLVGSVLTLFDLISNYVECAILLDYVGGEAIHRLVQVLGVYNSRSCQLVLGAGAMHLVGLKAITAKHLALSSQCLGLIIASLPAMCNALQERLNSKHHRMLKELDRVIKDYKDHRSEIFQKLVKIMEDLVNSFATKFVKEVQVKYGLLAVTNKSTGSSINGMKSTEKFAVDSEVHSHIKSLMKQAKQLHRVLSSLITPSQRDDIFNQIAETFNEVFHKQLSTIPFPGSDDDRTLIIRSHISVQMKFICKQLGTLHPLSYDVQKGFERWFVFSGLLGTEAPSEL